MVRLPSAKALKGGAPLLHQESECWPVIMWSSQSLPKSLLACSQGAGPGGEHRGYSGVRAEWNLHHPPDALFQHVPAQYDRGRCQDHVQGVCDPQQQAQPGVQPAAALPAAAV